MLNMLSPQQSVQYNGREIPVIGHYDVVIIGGGSSGSACAIRCARLGLATLVIDRFSMLGGTAVNATVCPMMPSYVEHRGIFNLVEKHLRKIGETTRDDKTTMMWFSPEKLGWTYETLLTDAGGKILYDATLVDVLDEEQSLKGEKRTEKSGAKGESESEEACIGESECNQTARHLTHLVVMSAQGLVAVSSKIMVDASGDAILARLAGVPTDSGDETGANQVCSLRFTMGGIDVEKYRQYCLSLEDDFSPLTEGFFFESAMVAGRNFKLEPIFRKGVEAGLLKESDLRYYQAFSVPGKPGVMAFNCPHIASLVSNTSAMGRSEALIEAHSTIERLAHFLREMMPGFEDSYIIGVAPLLGVRESWRIRGVYTLNEEDYVARARFDDGLAKGDWFIDVHSQSKGLFHQKGYERGEYYEIPYRCFIAPEVDNLLTIGRCISTTFLMQASVRIIPTVIDMGDAAGCACALSLDTGVMPLHLDGEKVREFADSVEHM